MIKFIGFVIVVLIVLSLILSFIRFYLGLAIQAWEFLYCQVLYPCVFEQADALHLCRG